MRLNYFDLGLHHVAWELGKMHKEILPKLKIEDYRIYGFEGHPKYCKIVSDRYTDSRVKIINKVIADEEKDFDLYLAKNTVGHSIFATKNNVSKKKVTVQGVVFSKFLEKNCPNFKNEFNVLKVNIEGAEWHLFNDLVNSGYHKYFLFCGAGHDVDKVSELDSEKYWKLIEDNKIVLHRFTDHKPERNEDIYKLIRDGYAKNHSSI